MNAQRHEYMLGITFDLSLTNTAGVFFRTSLQLILKINSFVLDVSFKSQNRGHPCRQLINKSNT